MVFTGYINKKNKTNRKIIMEKQYGGYEMSFPLRARDRK